MCNERFFVKSQHTLLECCLLTKKFEFNKKNIFFKIYSFFLIALYGAILRGSVFNMKFRVLSREFESIEISPGFAQLLGESWN